MKYLDELYSFIKILVCFSALIFFSAFYFLKKDHESEEEPPVLYCGTSYLEENRESVNLDAEGLKGKELFEGNCTACHAIHKVKVGPALKNIAQRRDIKWIRSFVRNPMKKIMVKKDPYAIALYKEYNKTVMTAFPDLTDKEIDAIVTYLDPSFRSRSKSLQ